MSLRTPFSRVHFLGSAKDGTHHWWMQRVTAVAMVPLTLWFIIEVALHAGEDHAEFKAFLSGPATATLFLLFVGVGFYHLKLGLQVVIEDYVPAEGARVALLLANAFLCWGLGLACAVSVLKLAVGG